MGLPARFTVGLQNQIEHFVGDTRDRSFTLEARYALANWNKLPLNPAISAEYRFGLSNAARDSGELGLLISHDFPHLIEWAMNVFVDRELAVEKGRASGSPRASKSRSFYRKKSSRSDSKCNTAAAARQRGLGVQ